jgi:transcriptional regulator with XRE-family HTH domain
LDYPKVLKTLGDHLRKKRLDLKLLQKQVAQIIGFDEASIWNWENNLTKPSLRAVPKIIEFLGYKPPEIETTLGQKISTARWLRGLSQKALARRFGIDPTTLGRWERDEGQPSKKLLEKLNCYFTLPYPTVGEPGQ